MAVPSCFSCEVSSLNLDNQKRVVERLKQSHKIHRMVTANHQGACYSLVISKFPFLRNRKIFSDEAARRVIY